jgi:hypothetical protein
MNKLKISVIFCISILSIIPISGAVGQSISRNITYKNSPLFENSQQIFNEKQLKTLSNKQYLKDNINNYQEFYFTKKTSCIIQRIEYSINNLNNDFYHLLFPLINDKDQLIKIFTEINKCNTQSINSICKLNQVIPCISTENIVKQYNISTHFEPYSTVFPFCVIMVFITILLIYAYILVVDISEFIIDVLENTV